MRTRSATWKNLASRGDFAIETVAVIGGVEYSTITAPAIDGGTLPGNELSVGNTIASTCKFTVMTTDTIPKSAQVIIKSRLADGQENGVKSEWREMGTC